MNWLIHGVAPHDTGAGMMLLAVLQSVRASDPDAVVTVPHGSIPHRWRVRHGLHQLYDPALASRLGWRRDWLPTERERRAYHLVLAQEIDVVLDASGYAYGDGWPPEHVEGCATAFERFRRYGARIILLPQTFGPFKNTRVRRAGRRILAAADLVFARDNESLVSCRALAPRHPAIHRAPDFTNLLAGRVPDSWVRHPRHVALVPNRQVLVREDGATARAYVNGMAEGLRLLAGSGFQPFLLVLGAADRELAEEIARVAQRADPILHPVDPVAVKGVLGACGFVIGSHFHALVSALSRGVPAVGISWSHGFRPLFEEYGVPGLYSPPGAGPLHLMELVRHLQEEPSRRTVSTRLRRRSLGLRGEVRAMWGRTFDHLASP